MFANKAFMLYDQPILRVKTLKKCTPSSMIFHNLTMKKLAKLDD